MTLSPFLFGLWHEGIGPPLNSTGRAFGAPAAATRLRLRP